VCIRWKIKCWVLLMHGVTMKFVQIHSDVFQIEQRAGGWTCPALFAFCLRISCRKHLKVIGETDKQRKKYR